MKVFISYAREDRDFARQLAKELEQAGYQAWTHDQVLPGDNFAAKIGEALDTSHAMVVVVTPASMKSPWVRNEIMFATGSPRYENRLLPVVVQPTRNTPPVFDVVESVRAASPKSAVKGIISKLEKVSR